MDSTHRLLVQTGDECLGLTSCVEVNGRVLLGHLLETVSVCFPLDGWQFSNLLSLGQWLQCLMIRKISTNECFLSSFTLSLHSSGLG